MKHGFLQQVFYSDTDSYGVVWHGNYLRWLEMGRCLLCEKAGFKVSELEDDDIVLPVAELNVKYKSSAHLDDILNIQTEVIESSRCSLTFYQKITDEKGGRTYIEATVKVVAINKSGKLYRSLPEQILKICAQ